MSIQSGATYKIKNGKSATYLDKSIKEPTKVHGWASRDGVNQRWQASQIPGTNQWSLRNQQDGKYLAVRGNPHDDADVFASEQEYRWDINHADDVGNGFRVFAAGTVFNLDLTGFGKADNDTRVAVWGRNNHNLNQIWFFEQV